MLQDGTSGDWIGTFSGHKGAVWLCHLDATGSLAATASGDFSVKVWDAIVGNVLRQFAHHHIVKTCDFAPNSRRLASGGHEGILRVYDLVTHLQQVPSTSSSSSSTAAKPSTAPANIEIAMDNEKKIFINKCCWKTNTMLLAGCADGKIRFYDIPESGSVNTEPVTIFETDNAEIRDMEITKLAQNQQEILTVAAGNKVYFFDLNQPATTALLHVYTMPIHFKEEGGASLHPIHGDTFVAGGSDLWVRVYNFHTGQELECLKGHHGPIRCLRYSPDGKAFASGSEDGTIRLWKTIVDE